MGKPGSVKLTAQSKTIKASWSKVKNATSYTVVYGTSKSQVAKGKGTTVTVKGTSKTIKKLKAGKAYYVSVRAVMSYDDHLGNKAKVESKWTTPKKATVKK